MPFQKHPVYFPPGVSVFLLAFPLPGALEIFQELVHFLLGFVASDLVAFLDLSDQLIVVAFNFLDLVVGQFTPLFLDLPASLSPFGG